MVVGAIIMQVRLVFGFAASAIAMAGCSTVPRLEDTTRRTTFDVVQQIRCEARRAVMEHGEGYTTAAIAYDFSFHVAEANANKISSIWRMPFLNGTNFSLDASSGLTLGRQTTRNIKIVDSFDELRNQDCSSHVVQPNFAYPVAGDVGVYEVVSTFIRLQNVNTPSAGEVFTFGDTLKFTTFVGGDVAPKVTVAPVTGQFGATEVAGTFGASRTDVHQVILGLAGGRTSTARGQRLTLGSSLAVAGATYAAVPSTLLSTTLLQSAADAKDRALVELDRQRILELQARASTLLVGP
jgi:hypothetical protein